MNYGELRSFFKDLLNRDDCTDTQADNFISMGLRRVERLLRTPIQKATLTKTIDGTWLGFEPIPIDYIGLFSITVDDVPVPRLTRGQTGVLNGFLIEGSDIKFYPDLQAGQVLKIVYFNEFLRGVADSTITDYSLVLTDVATYAALVFAADFFLDARKDAWESTLQGLIQEVQMMSDIDETSGGSMAITPWGGGIV